jgi:spore coat polysaccharide biosynthesis protein SpsF
MKTGFLITARLKSTRLPKKLMLELNNRTIISSMIDRLKQSEHLDAIVVATSTNPDD